MAGKLLGKPATNPVAKVLSCPACGGQVQIRVPGKSLVATCSSCHAVVDASQESAKVLAQQNKAERHDPVLTLGTRGRIRGEKFEVIGFVRKTDETGVYHWQEYLLFNPFQGFRWLVENQGHWNYFIPLKTPPKAQGGEARINGKKYRLFLRGGSKVEYVLGEFYWRVKQGDAAVVADYVNPPEMLSSEQVAGEINWSLGEYVDGKTVREAFGVKGIFPTSSGVAPNQPSPMARAKGIYRATFIMLAAMFVCQLLSSFASADREVFSQTGQVAKTAASPSAEFLSEPFPVAGSGNVESALSAQVDNNWVELDMSLVDEGSGESFDFRQMAEFYAGYEGGESWSEGDRRDEFVIPEVPSGNYRLRIAALSDKVTHYSLSLKRDTPLWSNFFLCALALLMIPCLLGFMQYMFEVSRWRESDNAPAYILKSEEE